MFGWLRKRRYKEQRVLLYQNSMAAEASLAGYVHDDAEVSSRLLKIADETRSIASQADGKVLPLSSTTRLLEMNSELRRLYDTTASRHLESFDQAHTPLMGWKFYLSEEE